jgi:hypothetical protein
MILTLSFPLQAKCSQESSVFLRQRLPTQQSLAAKRGNQNAHRIEGAGALDAVQIHTP